MNEGLIRETEMSSKADDTVVIAVPLSGETAERLRNLADFCHADPRTVAASLLHDILKDDEEYNIPAAARVGNPTIN
jgi:hypothetical protein